MIEFAVVVELLLAALVEVLVVNTWEFEEEGLVEVVVERLLLLLVTSMELLVVVVVVVVIVGSTGILVLSWKLVEVELVEFP